MPGAPRRHELYWKKNKNPVQKIDRCSFEACISRVHKRVEIKTQMQPTQTATAPTEDHRDTPARKPVVKHFLSVPHTHTHTCMTGWDWWYPPA